jgi:DNA gyrase/topoisomerase IV subunit A
MDFDSVSLKHCNELEQLITQMLKIMRSAKLQQHPIYASLQDLEKELGEARRGRYDDNNSEYSGY